MADNSYVFYSYLNQDAQRVNMLQLVNLVTADISNPRTVEIDLGPSPPFTIFECGVVGAAYDALQEILYTLVYCYDSDNIIHYRLAQTINFTPISNSSIILNSSYYTTDMNSGTYSSEEFRNLTIDNDGNLYCASMTGKVYSLNNNGTINNKLHNMFLNNAGTIAINDGIFYAVSNVGGKDFFNRTDILFVTEIINDSSSPVSSVANNQSNNIYYYYNVLNELWSTEGTLNTTFRVDNSDGSNTLDAQTLKQVYYPILFFGPTACIHSSSKVLLSDGSYKLITNVTSGDQVYSPDCKTAIVKEVVPCWLKVPNNPFHKCVVFEKDSLAPNVPSELFIIDPGHPMSFATNYDNNGLMSAKEYVNGKTIYTSDYNDIKERFPEDMKHNRYDLVLNRGDTYVANNVIVKSRTSFKTAGYDLEVD
jgi:hypothetical protein